MDLLLTLSFLAAFVVFWASGTDSQDLRVVRSRNLRIAMTAAGLSGLSIVAAVSGNVIFSAAFVPTLVSYILFLKK